MRTAIGFAVVAALSGSALAQQAPTPPSAAELAAMQARDAAERAVYDALPNGPGSGPFAAVMETDSTIPNHVVYRPANLKAVRKTKLGVLAWGNGGCRPDGASARQHLLEIASHGYVVIAPGKVYSGPGAIPEKIPERVMGADGKLPPVATTPADVKAGIDWALAENTRRGSQYKGRIDPKQIAVAGHSCGGLQAIVVAADPRIKAVLIHNSGVFPDGVNPISGMIVSKAELARLHTPVVYFLGGPGDIAYPNGTDDYARINHVPIAKLNMPVGHGGTFRTGTNGGTVAAASVDWLEWQLRGDKVAARSFVGVNCRLCVVPGWNMERKGW